jgi:starch synthase
MTIHNIAFQGLFSAEAFHRLGTMAGELAQDDLEFYGRISFLKAGIRFADRLTTVSPTYAREILTPELGCGLHGVLSARGDALEGILNGIDVEVWNPKDPTDIRYPFDRGDLSGKARCKAALQEETGLAVDPAIPVLAFVSRLTDQKMADLLPALAPWLAKRGVQLLVVGVGDRAIESRLRATAAEHPGRVAAHVGYTETLAKRTFAGADMVLAPARFEPCGLVQMYAMRYGALPIVRRTGGLADTVNDAAGFSFEEATVEAMQGAIERALGRFAESLAWRRMQLHAMDRDFSWRDSAAKYRSLYETLCPVSPAARPAEDIPAARERLQAVH